MKYSILLLAALFLLSCNKNLRNLQLTEDEAWQLSYRMVLSNMQDRSELGIQQFDSLLATDYPLKPEILSTGLQLLHAEGKNRKMKKIISRQDSVTLQTLCMGAFLPSISDEISICNDIAVEHKVTHPDLQRELIILFINDQEVRGGNVMDLAAKYGINPNNVLYDESVNTDSRNREKLKQIIAEHGFPTQKMVGIEGVRSSFFIIQHADQDNKWQLAQLEHVKQAVERGDLEKKEYAYLYDRIKVNAGEKQLYGTQFEKVDPANQIARLAEVEDPKNLNQRRKEMGLMPIEIYREVMLSQITN